MIYINFVCDGNCKVVWHAKFDEESEAYGDLLEASRTHGWTMEGDKTFCKTCSELTEQQMTAPTQMEFEFFYSDTSLNTGCCHLGHPTCSMLHAPGETRGQKFWDLAKKAGEMPPLLPKKKKNSQEERIHNLILGREPDWGED